MATWWTPDEQRENNLKNSDGWKYVLTEHGRFRVYYATSDAHPGKTWIMSSVSSVLKARGTHERLMDWAVDETLRDVLAQLLPGSEERPKHLRNLEIVKELMLNPPGSKRKNCTFSELMNRMLKEFGANPSISLPVSRVGAILEEATKARFRTMETAGELGTRAHYFIELWINNKGSLLHSDPETGEIYTYDMSQEPPEVQSAFSAFLKFWESESLDFACTETAVGDIEIGVAGTLDGLAKDANGELIMLDWKTSGGVYDKFLLQVAGYCRMWHRMGNPWPTRAYVVRVDKKTAALQVVPVYRTRDEYRRLCRQWGATVATFQWNKWAESYLREMAKDSA